MNEFDAEIKARRFVGEAGAATAPAAIESYVVHAGAKLLVVDDLSSAEPGYTLLTRNGPLIHVNGRDPPERQRFTVCHEIGHIYLGLDSEHDHGPAWSYARRPPNEVCCDVFAAELLLPHRLFMAAAARLDLTFDTVDLLRARFEASRQATASRLAATAKLPCAYVLSEDGRVHHLVRSATLRSANAWIQRGSPLSEGSMAHAARGGPVANGAGVVAGDVWFDGWQDVMLREHSIYLATFDQTLTLVYCEDLDELDAMPRSEKSEREDDGALLAELDGVLPWPSGKKRKG